MTPLMAGISCSAVAGCLVSAGRLQLGGGALYRVRRGGREGEVASGAERLPASSLFHFKDAVTEVAKGKECGAILGDWSRYDPGDVLECFVEKSIKRSL